MLETASDFKGYIQRLGIARFEGILLRYLAEAFRALDRTVPIDKRDEQMKDIIAWLGLVVSSVDSSLVDEWANAGASLDAAPPEAQTDAVVRDRRGLTVLVRNALISRVRLASLGRVADLGEMMPTGALASALGRRPLMNTSPSTKKSCSMPMPVRRNTWLSTNPMKKQPMCGVFAKFSATSRTIVTSA